MPSGKPFSCSAIGSEIAGIPHRFASGVKAKLRHRLPNQSSTDGLSEIVRYSVVPTFGVGSAVIGVRMMSHCSKNAPKPRDVVLKTACMRARSANEMFRPASQIRMLTGSTKSAGGLVSPRTERHWQPRTDTSPVKSEGCGASENTPRETLSPMLPLTPAGMRIEPPPSVACAIGTTPAATMAALPADDPHVV